MKRKISTWTTSNIGLKQIGFTFKQGKRGSPCPFPESLGIRKKDAGNSVACVSSVSVQFRSKERGTRVKEREGVEKKGRKRLQKNPSIFKTALLDCHAWFYATTFGAVISCQYCATSRANQALRSLANAGFQNRGVCLQAFPSFLSPPAPLSFFGSRFISRAVKTENPVPRFFFAPKLNANTCYAG